MMSTSTRIRAVLVAVALTLFALPALAQDAPLRIAVVDLDLVVAKSPLGQQLAGRLEAFQQQAQTEAETMQTAARDIRTRLTEGVNSLSEEKLNELQKQFEDKQIEIRRFRDDKQREAQKLQSEGLREIEQQLEPVFEQIRTEGNYDLILNRVPGVVIMAGDRVDITDQVVARLESSNAGG
ncbi:MAG: OmpH family outer membrane protein [Acidobacteriota bacterium]